MVEGVTKGYEKVLEINGVGYKAALSGRTLNLNLGFTHPIAFPLPEGIEAKVDKQTVVTIRGRDRYLVVTTVCLSTLASMPSGSGNAMGDRKSTRLNSSHL